MFCKKCNTKLSENSVFCHICGEKTEQNNLDIKDAVEETQTKPELYQSFNPLNDFSTPSYPLTLREKAMVFIDKFGKPLFIIVIAIAVIISIISACTSSNSDSSSYSSYDTEDSYYHTQSGYSEETLESIAASELYQELSNFKTMAGMGLSTWYDLGATRYSIGSIVEDNGVYIIRGTFSLYDYYGKIASNYYNETFTVRVSGTNYSCTTSL